MGTGMGCNKYSSGNTKGLQLLDGTRVTSGSNPSGPWKRTNLTVGQLRKVGLLGEPRWRCSTSVRTPAIRARRQASVRSACTKACTSISFVPLIRSTLGESTELLDRSGTALFQSRHAQDGGETM